jgi:hypothetical protein
MKSSAACSINPGVASASIRVTATSGNSLRLISHAAADHDLLRHDRVDDVAQAGGEVGHL